MREIHLTSTQGFGTNRICKQRMLRIVSETVQSLQSLPYWHTYSMKADESSEQKSYTCIIPLHGCATTMSINDECH